jgi:pyruvyltransferase
MKMQISRFIPPGVKRLAKRVVFPHTIHLYWSKTCNWGDALNPYLIGALSGKTVRFASGTNSDKWIAIGSILAAADARTSVWGAGFISETDEVKAMPRVIHALRGPLTWKKLRSAGISAPEVFGDPALLVSKIYKPPIARDFRLGIIPHYVDKPLPMLERAKLDSSVLVIDVESPIEKFIDHVCRCELIVSSSLHGVICADAYGIPAVAVSMSNYVVGGRFKFTDYALAVSRKAHAPLPVVSFNDLLHAQDRAETLPRGYHTGHLLHSCPFLRPDFSTFFQL